MSLKDFLLLAAAVSAFGLPPLPSAAHGAMAGDVDLSFNAGTGCINGAVHAAARQPDGKLVIAGDFTMVKDLVRYKIARLLPNGRGDPSFHVNPNSGITAVHSLALQPDGKVVVGHDTGVARLNADGSEDAGFQRPRLEPDPFSPWVPPSVFAVALQPDGKIILGGSFQLGSLFRSLLRLNADGTVEASFDAYVDAVFPFVPCVKAISIQQDGKILIAGSFLSCNDKMRRNIARLESSGHLDAGFDAGTDYDVHALGVQPDGRVLLGGAFTLVQGRQRGAVARLHADGSIDEDFAPGAGANGTVRSIAVQPDGKVVIGGFFQAVNLTSRKHLARLNANGSLDDTFDPGPGPRSGVILVSTQPDGTLLVGTDLAGVSENYDLLTRLHADGHRDLSFTPGGGILEPSTAPVVLQPDGKILFAGVYDRGDGTVVRGVCRLHADGSLDSSFIPDPVSDGYISAIAVQPDGKVLVGGGVGLINGTEHHGLARLHSDGRLDTTFNLGPGVTYGVRSILVQPDGKVLIAGTIDPPYIENARPFILRLNADGSVDTAFRPRTEDLGQLESPYLPIALQPDGKVLVGGSAQLRENGTKIGGLNRLHADGSLDTGFHNKYLGRVSSILLQPDGSMFVGGALMTSRTDGYPSVVARLFPDGSVDPSFAHERWGPGKPGATPAADRIALQADGKLLCTGDYILPAAYDPDPEIAAFGIIQGIFRLNSDASVDAAFSPAGGYPLAAASLALQPDGRLLITHGFEPIKGVMRPFLARLHTAAPPPPVPFAAWAEAFGLSGHSAAPDADPDRDGLPNAAEFVFGSHPSEPDVPARNAAATISGGSLLFTFQRDDRSETPGAILTVESGTDLMQWPAVFQIRTDTADSTPGVSITENGPAPDSITVAIPIESHRARFARLKVTISQ